MRRTETPGSKKATHGCKCGLGAGGRGPCGRAPRCQQTYQARLSGPLIDRIDLIVDVPPVTAADLALPPPSEGSAEAAARIGAARAAQAERQGPEVNARLQGEALDAAAEPDAAGRALLSRAAEAAGLTARGWSRTLRLARTIADLEGSTGVRRLHVAEALAHRRAAPGELAEAPAPFRTPLRAV